MIHTPMPGAVRSLLSTALFLSLASGSRSAQAEPPAVQPGVETTPDRDPQPVGAAPAAEPKVDEAREEPAKAPAKASEATPKGSGMRNPVRASLMSTRL